MKYIEFLSSFNSTLFFLVDTEIVLPLEKYNLIGVAINAFSEVIFYKSHGTYISTNS